MSALKKPFAPPSANGTPLPPKPVARQTKTTNGGFPASSGIKGKLKGTARKMKSSTAALKRLVGQKLKCNNAPSSTKEQAKSKPLANSADLIGLGPLAAVPSPAKYPRTCAVKEHQRFTMSQDGYFRPVLVKGNPKVPGSEPPSIAPAEGTQLVNAATTHDLQGAQSMAKDPAHDPFALPFCTLGLYEIVSTLGSGPKGPTGSKSQFIANWQSKQLVNEIAMLRAAQGAPHVVPFLDAVYSVDGKQLEGFTMHASMGACTVKNLRRLYEGAGMYIPPLIMVRIAAAMATCAANLHRMNITHLDWKQDNILLDGQWDPSWHYLDFDMPTMVTDFGCGHRVPESEGVQHTVPSFMGANPYAAPELFAAFTMPIPIEDKPQVDLYAADVYTFGRALLSLALMQDPQEHTTFDEELARARAANPEGLNLIETDEYGAHADLIWLCSWMCNPDPTQR
ncbi:hypothetical protein WJX73_002402 [Symbiochloris irregularis]|uniref:Protein kinase domain-containing protein n=1 Tax=Symbiochloris irregularis TaxID=706552 RepID=A0AAW1PXH4_9CHLO